MRSILGSFLLISAISAAQLLPAPTAVTDPKQLQTVRVDDLRTFTAEKLFNTRTIGGSTWSPDGKQVAFIANITGRDNLWIIPATGGWPVQLTSGEQRQTLPRWSPDGKWIAYMSDTDGDEMWDIFLVSPITGEVVNLTATRKTDEEIPAWSPDGKQIACMTRAKDSPSFEIDIIEVETRKTRHITRDSPREFGNYFPFWSPDGKALAWTQANLTGKDSNILVMELASGATTNLTEHTGDKFFRAASFSPDGKRILVTSSAANGYANVTLLDVATRKISWLTEDKWEIAAGDFAPSGKSVTWTANVDGDQEIYLYDIDTKKTTRLDIPQGWNSFTPGAGAFSRDGGRLLYYHESGSSPRDLWSFDLKSGSSLQLTQSLFGGLRATDMVEPVLVHYPSADGKFTLSAFAYVPHSIQRNAKFPAIVYIHGGPASQATNSFDPVLQYLLNLGYLVIAPNYRGSSGYGKEFQEANHQDAGGAELEDVVAAARFIQQSGFVDPSKLVVMGRSYGGYLTMMAVTKHPEMWAAAVPIVPFVNWLTEFKSADPQVQEFDRQFMGDPVKDKALWEDRSPINFIDRVKAPLLLLAGGNDPHCPKSEAKQVSDEIKQRGGRVQLKIYENEGHAFSRVENLIDACKRVGDFLKVNVPSPGCGCTVFE